MTDPYPCPICKADPVFVRSSDGTMMLKCWCNAVQGKTVAEVLRRWNGLYCANDPATVEDCA